MEPNLDNDTSEAVDLVGGPFAVLESDPGEQTTTIAVANYAHGSFTFSLGLFTMLLRRLGVQDLEVVEVYDIAPWAIDHLNPRGLIFCYLCPEDVSGEDEDTYDASDPDAEDIWFAHQLSDDACASQALLNVIFNCENVELGDILHTFLSDTRKMSPKV